MRTKSLIPIAIISLVVSLASAPVSAQKPAAAAPPSTNGPAMVLQLTAKSANVSQVGTPVKIQILKWSADEDRNKVVAALSAPPTPPPAAAGAGADGAARGAGAGAGAAARGGGAGAGRGGGRGGRGEAAAPQTPEQRLEAALTAAPTVGYIWTNDVTGYSIKYAYRTSQGGERIILATDRRLGMYAASWKPAAPATATDFDFTVIEIRLDAKGLGEGKTSLAAKVVAEGEPRTLAIDNYAAAPAQLQGVKR